MKKALLGLMLLLSPAAAYAAGFATQSIFLSQSPVTEGDTVRVHATVSNDATSTFSGTVVLQDGTETIGSVAVTLAAGTAQTVSTSWSPLAGSHTLTAQLETPSGTVIQQTSANFNVAAKPQPAAAASSAGSPTSGSVQSSAQIQQTIGTYSPQAASLSAPVFNTIDDFRSNAAGLINTQLATTKSHLASTPQPLPSIGSVTSSPSIPATASGVWFILYTLYFYILTIASFLITNVAVFYPFIVIVFFYILWRIFRRVRRPRY